MLWWCAGVRVRRQPTAPRLAGGVAVWSVRASVVPPGQCVAGLRVAARGIAWWHHQTLATPRSRVRGAPTRGGGAPTDHPRPTIRILEAPCNAMCHACGQLSVRGVRAAALATDQLRRVAHANEGGAYQLWPAKALPFRDVGWCVLPAASQEPSHITHTAGAMHATTHVVMLSLPAQQISACAVQLHHEPKS